MTALQAYDAVLVESNKVNAPNMLLEDFNYIINKAINNYINKRYNIYDVSQQLTDDLRVLKASAILDVQKETLYDGLDFMDATYETVLPNDYLHILNCICVYRVNKTYKCYDAGRYWRTPATRLTADLYSQVLDNFWLKPTYKRPYYYIHNVNTQWENPTNPITEERAIKNDTLNDDISTSISSKKGTDFSGKYYPFMFEIPEIPTELEPIDQQPSTQEDPRDTGNELPENLINIQSTQSTLLQSQTEDGIAKYKYIFSGIYKGYYSWEATKNGEKYILYTKSKTGKDVTLYRFSEDKFEETKQKVTIEQPTSEEPKYTETDGQGNTIIKVEELPTSISLKGVNKASAIEKAAQVRYGNPSEVRLEIRYGTDDSVFELCKVIVDYIKTPQYIRLTQDQLDKTEDTSQMLEFPDYVCQEIINELVHLVMEKDADPRLQTHPVVTQSIANPVQQQTQQPAASAAQ